MSRKPPVPSSPKPPADVSEAVGASKPSEPVPLAPGLYLVATPIGNLTDITIRALETLRAADLIACEDTRITSKLCRAYGIDTPLVAYHDHNAETLRPKLIADLKRGETIALVSDAGTPLISDPGYKLVRSAIDQGIEVTSLPGASAALSALTLSGLPSNRFFFAGFLPVKGGERRQRLSDFAAVPGTLIFFESAKRLPASLAAMANVLGARPAAVARELTKLFEEVRRGPLDVLAKHYALAGPPKGEVVVVVGPPLESDPGAGFDLDAALEDALEANSLRDAVDAVTAESGLPRKLVYKRALVLARGHGQQRSE